MICTILPLDIIIDYLFMAFGHLSTGLLRNPAHLAALRAD
jgi:hypothetical protein